jgi:hypothetical protein
MNPFNPVLSMVIINSINVSTSQLIMLITQAMYFVFRNEIELDVKYNNTSLDNPWHTVAQISVPMFACFPLKSILHNTS